MGEAVLHHEVVHTLGHVLHAEWERHRDGGRHDVKGYGIALGQLCSHIGERVDGAAEIVLSQVSAQECREMMLQMSAVEGVRRRSRRGAWLLITEAQALQHVDGSVDVGGAHRRLDLLQAPIGGDDDVEAAEAHERAWIPSFGVVGHPKPC